MLPVSFVSRRKKRHLYHNRKETFIPFPSPSSRRKPFHVSVIYYNKRFFLRQDDSLRPCVYIHGAASDEADSRNA